MICLTLAWQQTTVGEKMTDYHDQGLLELVLLQSLVLSTPVISAELAPDLFRVMRECCCEECCNPWCGQMYHSSSVGLVGQESWASWTMPTMTIQPNGLPQCFVSSRSKIIRFIFRNSDSIHWMFKTLFQNEESMGRIALWAIWVTC